MASGDAPMRRSVGPPRTLLAVGRREGLGVDRDTNTTAGALTHPGVVVRERPTSAPKA